MGDVPLVRSHYPAAVRTEVSNDVMGIGRNDLTVPYVSFVDDEGLGEHLADGAGVYAASKRESHSRTFILSNSTIDVVEPELTLERASPERLLESGRYRARENHSLPYERIEDYQAEKTQQVRVNGSHAVVEGYLLPRIGDSLARSFLALSVPVFVELESGA